MVKSKKLEKSELENLTNLRDQYGQVTSQFGQLKVEKMLLKQQLENLEKIEFDLEQKYAELQKEESGLVESLNKKYGRGQLNLETGELTPADLAEPELVS